MSNTERLTSLRVEEKRLERAWSKADCLGKVKEAARLRRAYQKNIDKLMEVYNADIHL